jgi:hypothetical protein
MSTTITIPTSLEQKIAGRAAAQGKDFEQFTLETLEQTFDHLEAIEGIREGLESMQRGDGTPARAFFSELRQEFGIPERTS